MRRYVFGVAALVFAVLLVGGGVMALRISGSIAVATGYGPVAHLEAFGRWPDREETRRGWRAARRFRYAGFGLMTLAAPAAVLGAWQIRRARRSQVARGYE